MKKYVEELKSHGKKIKKRNENPYEEEVKVYLIFNSKNMKI